MFKRSSSFFPSASFITSASSWVSGFYETVQGKAREEKSRKIAKKEKKHAHKTESTNISFKLTQVSFARKDTEEENGRRIRKQGWVKERRENGFKARHFGYTGPIVIQLQAKSTPLCLYSHRARSEFPEDRNQCFTGNSIQSTHRPTQPKDS